jgi:hypothetical protein
MEKQLSRPTAKGKKLFSPQTENVKTELELIDSFIKGIDKLGSGECDFLAIERSNMEYAVQEFARLYQDKSEGLHLLVLDRGNSVMLKGFMETKIPLKLKIQREVKAILATTEIPTTSRWIQISRDVCTYIEAMPSEILSHYVFLRGNGNSRWIKFIQK